MNWNGRLVNIATAAAAGAACSPPAPTCAGGTVLDHADRAMGGTSLKTLRYAGSGTGATFGQAYQPGMAWPRLTYSSFSRDARLRERRAARGFRAQPRRANRRRRGAADGHGRAARRLAWCAATHAWNLAGPAPVAAPLAVDARTHDLWTTPHGVIKAAIRNKAADPQRGRQVGGVASPSRGASVPRCWIGADGMVERVDSVLPNAVHGRHADRHAVLGLPRFRRREIPDAHPPAPGRLRGAGPAGGAGRGQCAGRDRAAGAGPVVRRARDRGEGGRGRLVPGRRLAQQRRHRDARPPDPGGKPAVRRPRAAVLAEAKKLAPGKPMRFVVNSHHHFDHAGGLRAAAAEGATVVVSEQARPWWERVLANAEQHQPGCAGEVRPQAPR